MTAASDPVAVAWAALSRAAVAAGRAVTLVDGVARPWWSATFAGDAVWLTVRVDDDAGPWLAGLPDADLPLADRFVADAQVERKGPNIVLISLLILDAD